MNNWIWCHWLYVCPKPPGVTTLEEQVGEDFFVRSTKNHTGNPWKIRLRHLLGLGTTVLITNFPGLNALRLTSENDLAGCPLGVFSDSQVDEVGWTILSEADTLWRRQGLCCEVTGVSMATAKWWEPCTLVWTVNSWVSDGLRRGYKEEIFSYLSFFFFFFFNHATRMQHSDFLQSLCKRSFAFTPAVKQGLFHSHVSY